MDRIAQIKLLEIQKQRQRLLNLFDDVSKDAAGAGNPYDKLKILLEGLLKKRQSLGEKTYTTSSNINHLEVLLQQAEHGTCTKELLESWCAKLEREVANGRAQTEFAYIFGSILQEWATSQLSSPEGKGEEALLEGGEGEGEGEGEEDDYNVIISPKDREEFVGKVEGLFAPVPDAGVDFGFFEGLVEAARENFSEASFLPENPAFQDKVSLAEIRAASQALCLDNLVSAATKRRLRALQTDDILANEYAGVATLMLRSYQTWDWPKQLPLKLLNNRSGKWRVFVEEDIITSIFLQVVGARWGAKLRTAFIAAWNAACPYPPYKDGSDSSYARHSQRILLLFSALPSTPTDVSASSEYGGGGGISGSSPAKGISLKQRMLQLLATESKRLREFGEAATFVSSDIKDFYLSAPHGLILRVLRGLGCPGPWVEFFARFLSPKVSLQEGGVKKEGSLSRGFPTGHALSKALHETLLFLHDLQMLEVGGVVEVRNFDDFYLWGETPEQAVQGFKALDTFIRKAGMSLNLTKSGHVQVNAQEEVVPGLPEGKIRYGLLAMDPKGNFVAEEASVKKFEAVALKRMQRTTSILAWVRAYNTHLKFLLRSLGDPCQALGPLHIQSVCKAMANLHNTVEGVGVIKYLQGELDKRFKERNHKVIIPEAWFYWPVTAGGLGVYNPFLTLSVFQLLINQSEAPTNTTHKFKKGTMRNQAVFQTLMNQCKATSPASTTELQGRIEDFKKRGSNLRGKKQGSLGVYWEWLICNYAHQIVEQVGSLEFTDPELVPVALIQGVGGGAANGDDDE